MSRAFHLRGPAPSSTTLLAGFLLATVALACALAVQAYGAARSHRTTTEAVLTDYAGIAAAEYGRVAREHLSRFFDVAFDHVPRRVRDGRMPEPLEVARELDDAVEAIRCACPALQEPSFVFRTDLRDGATAWEGTIDGPSRERVLSLVRERTPATGADRYAISMLDDDGPERGSIVLHATVFDDTDRAVMVYGTVLDRAALTELARHWYERHDLLPDAITRDTPEEQLVRIDVATPGGASFFSSHGDAEVGPSVADTLASYLSGMVVHASIRPEAADRLVIGGLPSSRLPFSLALLALTLAVGAAGLWEVRRHNQLARLREDFISSVSHELRTPLAQIRMLAELQADRKLRTAEEQERANRIMARESRRLTQLVENILHFSRSRAAGPAPAPLRPVALAECAQEVAEAFRPLIRPGSGSIDVDVDEGLHVLAQRDTLRQVLSNLLDNALKYGRAGQTVRISAAVDDGVVQIRVDDEGPGVPEDSRGVIWEPYVRLPRDVDSHRPGSGVGLAVVRTLVAGLGGSVRVLDAPSGGGRFVVELAAALGPESPPEGRARPHDSVAEETPVGAHTAD